VGDAERVITGDGATDDAVDATAELDPVLFSLVNTLSGITLLFSRKTCK
jgi:hypothetical protein